MKSVIHLYLIFIYHCLFTLALKSPNGEWPIRYTYINLRVNVERPSHGKLKLAKLVSHGV